MLLDYMSFIKFNETRVSSKMSITTYLLPNTLASLGLFRKSKNNILTSPRPIILWLKTLNF